MAARPTDTRAAFILMGSLYTRRADSQSFHDSWIALYTGYHSASTMTRGPADDEPTDDGVALRNMVPPELGPTDI